MQPTTNSIQAVDPILTNMLVGYKQADERFVAGRVFPAIPVEKDSGTYYIMTKKYWFLDAMKTRAPGARFARSGYGVESTTYATVQWALEHPIPIENRANSQLPLALETAGVQWLSQMSMIRKERAFSADFMKTSVWGTDDNNSSTDWDDFVSGDPVTNVQTATRTISNNTGMDANSLVMGYIVYQALQNHPDIIDRVKYTQLATLSGIRQALAAVFDVTNVLVSKASYNSANEGQTFSGAAIVDDDCLVCHIAPAPGIMTASAGYTFAWDGGGGTGVVAPMYREDQTDSDILKTKEQWDQKAVATDLGYFFADIV